MSDAGDREGAGLGTARAVERIVVGSDGSDGARKAVDWAARLAAQGGAEVVLVHGFEPLAELEQPPEPPVDFAAIRDRRVAELADQWAGPLLDLGVPHQTEVIEDRPVEALLSAAHEHDADLVVIGSHGRTGWRERVFGSVATELPGRLPCPTAIVPTDPSS